MPPQVGLCKLQSPNLVKIDEKDGECKGFVKASASWALVETGEGKLRSKM